MYTGFHVSNPDYLTSRILFVVIFNFLQSRVSDKNIIRKSSYETKYNCLPSTDKKTFERGPGAKTGWFST